MLKYIFRLDTGTDNESRYLTNNSQIQAGTPWGRHSCWLINFYSHVHARTRIHTHTNALLSMQTWAVPSVSFSQTRQQVSAVSVLKSGCWSTPSTTCVDINLSTRTDTHAQPLTHTHMHTKWSRSFKTARFVCCVYFLKSSKGGKHFLTSPHDSVKSFNWMAAVGLSTDTQPPAPPLWLVALRGFFFVSWSAAQLCTQTCVQFNVRLLSVLDPTDDNGTKILLRRFFPHHKTTSSTSNMSQAHFAYFQKTHTTSELLPPLLLLDLPVMLSALSVLGTAAGKDL